MGIAQTKVSWEDSIGNEHEPVFFRFSTNDPKEDVIVAWSKDGKKYELIETAPQEIKDVVSKSGLADVDKELRTLIAKEIKKDPKFDSSSISDDLLVQVLNALSQRKGKKFTWTDKGGKTVEIKENTSNSNSTPQTKNKKETVMVSGIKIDQYGEITTYKIGYDNQGVAKAVSYDNDGHAQEEKNFARFIGDNFKARTEKDPDYMDNLGSKEIGIRLKRYCSDPSIKWYGGDLSRSQLEEEVALHKKVDEMTRKEREEFNKKRRAELLKKYLITIFWCALGLMILFLFFC